MTNYQKQVVNAATKIVNTILVNQESENINHTDHEDFVNYWIKVIQSTEKTSLYFGQSGSSISINILTYEAQIAIVAMAQKGIYFPAAINFKLNFLKNTSIEIESEDINKADNISSEIINNLPPLAVTSEKAQNSIFNEDSDIYKENDGQITLWEFYRGEFYKIKSTYEQTYSALHNRICGFVQQTPTEFAKRSAKENYYKVKDIYVLVEQLKEQAEELDIIEKEYYQHRGNLIASETEEAFKLSFEEAENGVKGKDSRRKGVTKGVVNKSGQKSTDQEIPTNTLEYLSDDGENIFVLAYKLSKARGRQKHENKISQPHKKNIFGNERLWRKTANDIINNHYDTYLLSCTPMKDELSNILYECFKQKANQLRNCRYKPKQREKLVLSPEQEWAKDFYQAFYQSNFNRRLAVYYIDFNFKNKKPSLDHQMFRYKDPANDLIEGMECKLRIKVP